MKRAEGELGENAARRRRFELILINQLVALPLISSLSQSRLIRLRMPQLAIEMFDEIIDYINICSLRWMTF